jgi:hypothetical protein
VQRDALAGEWIEFEARGFWFLVDELYAGIQLELAPV